MSIRHLPSDEICSLPTNEIQQLPTVEFDDDVDCVVIIDDDEGNVEIREGTCEDYEDSDDELDFYDDDDEEWF